MKFHKIQFLGDSKFLDRFSLVLQQVKLYLNRKFGSLRTRVGLKSWNRNPTLRSVYLVCKTFTNHVLHLFS